MVEIIRKKGPLKVIICVITLWSFLFNIFAYDLLAWASGTPSELSTIGSDRAVGPGLSFKPLTPETFTLPYHLGEVSYPQSRSPLRVTYSVDNSARTPIVIHIQDAHCNYSCQQSIKEIIGYINSEYGVDLALLEGGAGNYDLSPFTEVEDIALRAKVADYFVKEGRVNGAELFAIMNPDKLTLKGLEDPEAYIANLNAYRESLKSKPEVEEILADIEGELDEEKKRVYSDRLKEFDYKKDDFTNERLKLNDYVSFLSSLRDPLDHGLTGRGGAEGPTTKGSPFRDEANVEIASPLLSQGLAMTEEKYPNLDKLAHVLELEKGINYPSANRERKKLIDKLAKRLSKNEVEVLVNQSVQFKENKLKPAGFYEYLLKKSSAIGINIKKKYQNLTKYKDYLDKYETIDKYKLFREIELLEDELFNTTADNDKQRELYKESKHLSLLKKLFNLSITRDEYNTLSSLRGALDIKDVKGDEAISLEPLTSYLATFERSYELAFERDLAFVRNIEAAKAKTLIILTGGFHGDNLEKLLIEKGYTYISILPKFDGNSEESPYFRTLQGEMLKEEKVIREAIAEISGLAILSMFSELKIEPTEKKVNDILIGLIREAESDKPQPVFAPVLGKNGKTTIVCFTYEDGEWKYEIMDKPRREKVEPGRGVRLESKPSPREIFNGPHDVTGVIVRALEYIFKLVVWAVRRRRGQITILQATQSLKMALFRLEGEKRRKAERIISGITSTEISGQLPDIDPTAIIGYLDMDEYQFNLFLRFTLDDFEEQEYQNLSLLFSEDLDFDEIASTLWNYKFADLVALDLEGLGIVDREVRNYLEARKTIQPIFLDLVRRHLHDYSPPFIPGKEPLFDYAERIPLFQEHFEKMSDYLSTPPPESPAPPDIRNPQIITNVIIRTAEWFVKYIVYLYKLAARAAGRVVDMEERVDLVPDRPRNDLPAEASTGESAWVTGVKIVGDDEDYDFSDEKQIKIVKYSTNTGLMLIRRVMYQGKLYVAKAAQNVKEEEIYLVPQKKILLKLQNQGVSGICKAEHFVECADSSRMILFEDFEKIHPGTTLHHMITETGRLPEKKAIELILKISSIVKALHDAGVYHWDIKPENIWVTKKNEVILFNFDGAFESREEFRQRELYMSGTPVYCSEVRKKWQDGAEYHDKDLHPAREEVFALAMTLRFMFESVISGDGKAVPPNVKSILARALDEERGFESVDEFIRTITGAYPQHGQFSGGYVPTPQYIRSKSAKELVEYVCAVPDNAPVGSGRIIEIIRHTLSLTTSPEDTEKLRLFNNLLAETPYRPSKGEKAEISEERIKELRKMLDKLEINRRKQGTDAIRRPTSQERYVSGLLEIACAKDSFDPQKRVIAIDYLPPKKVIIKSLENVLDDKEEDEFVRRIACLKLISANPTKALDYFEASLPAMAIHLGGFEGGRFSDENLNRLKERDAARTRKLLEDLKRNGDSDEKDIANEALGRLGKPGKGADEARDHGFIRQGEEAVARMDKAIRNGKYEKVNLSQEIESLKNIVSRVNVTPDSRGPLMQAIRRLSDPNNYPGTHLPIEPGTENENEVLARIIEGLKQNKLQEAINDIENNPLRTVEAQVARADDFALGWNRLDDPSLEDSSNLRAIYYSRTLLGTLAKPLREEYILHEALCRHFGHQEARVLQILLFKENYPADNVEGTLRYWLRTTILGNLPQPLDEKPLEEAQRTATSPAAARNIGEVAGLPVMLVGQFKKQDCLRIAGAQLELRKERDGFSEDTERITRVVTDFKDKFGNNAPDLVIFPEQQNDVEAVTLEDKQKREDALKKVVQKTGIAIGYCVNLPSVTRLNDIFYIILQPSEHNADMITVREFMKWGYVRKGRESEERVLAFGKRKIGFYICDETFLGGTKLENYIRQAEPDIIAIAADADTFARSNWGPDCYRRHKKPILFINLFKSDTDTSCLLNSEDYGDRIALGNRESVLMVDVPAPAPAAARPAEAGVGKPKIELASAIDLKRGKRPIDKMTELEKEGWIDGLAWEMVNRISEISRFTKEERQRFEPARKKEVLRYFISDAVENALDSIAKRFHEEDDFKEGAIEVRLLCRDHNIVIETIDNGVGNIAAGQTEWKKQNAESLGLTGGAGVARIFRDGPAKVFDGKVLLADRTGGKGAILRLTIPMPIKLEASTLHLSAGEYDKPGMAQGRKPLDPPAHHAVSPAQDASPLDEIIRVAEETPDNLLRSGFSSTAFAKRGGGGARRDSDAEKSTAARREIPEYIHRSQDLRLKKYTGRPRGYRSLFIGNGKDPYPVLEADRVRATVYAWDRQYKTGHRERAMEALIEHAAALGVSTSGEKAKLRFIGKDVFHRKSGSSLAETIAEQLGLPSSERVLNHISLLDFFVNIGEEDLFELALHGLIREKLGLSHPNMQADSAKELFVAMIELIKNKGTIEICKEMLIDNQTGWETDTIKVFEGTVQELGCKFERQDIGKTRQERAEIYLYTVSKKPSQKSKPTLKRKRASRPGKEEVPSQIGKQAEVAKVKLSVDGEEGSAEVVRPETGDSLGTLKLEKWDVTREALSENIAGVIEERGGDARKEIVSSILSRLENSPPLYTFDGKPIEDLFGFVRSEDRHEDEQNLLAIHKSLQDNPVATFHEIGEYLIETGKLQLTFRGLIGYIAVLLHKTPLYRFVRRWLKAYIEIEGIETPLLIRGEALSIALKDYRNPHYLLRALQREVFGLRDKELTKEIKGKQTREWWVIEHALQDDLNITPTPREVGRLTEVLRRADNGLALELKGEGGQDVRRYTIAKQDGAYVTNPPEAGEGFEAVEVYMSHDTSTIASLRPLTRGAHDVITDEDALEEIFGEYEEEVRVKGGSRKVRRVDRERVDNVIEKLRQIGGEVANTIADKLEALYYHPRKKSPDGKRIVRVKDEDGKRRYSQVNLIDDPCFRLSHAGGCGINIAYHEGMTDDEIEDEILHEAIAGVIEIKHGNGEIVHKLVNDVIDFVRAARAAERKGDNIERANALGDANTLLSIRKITNIPWLTEIDPVWPTTEELEQLRKEVIRALVQNEDDLIVGHLFYLNNGECTYDFIRQKWQTYSEAQKELPPGYGIENYASELMLEEFVSRYKDKYPLIVKYYGYYLLRIGHYQCVPQNGIEVIWAARLGGHAFPVALGTLAPSATLDDTLDAFDEVLPHLETLHELQNRVEKTQEIEHELAMRINRLLTAEVYGLDDPERIRGALPQIQSAIAELESKYGLKARPARTGETRDRLPILTLAPRAVWEVPQAERPKARDYADGGQKPSKSPRDAGAVPANDAAFSGEGEAGKDTAAAKLLDLYGQLPEHGALIEIIRMVLENKVRAIDKLYKTKKFEILKLWALEGLEHREISEELNILHRSSEQLKIRAIHDLTEWLRAHNVSREQIEQAINDIRETPLYEKRVAKYKAWYEPYIQWINGRGNAPEKIVFNKSGKEEWRWIKLLLQKLGVPEPKFNEGCLVPKKDEHGYIMEVIDENDKVRHGYLVRYLSGKRPKPVSSAPRQVPRNRKGSELFLLLSGYGPADLYYALEKINVSKLKSPRWGEFRNVRLPSPTQRKPLYITIPKNYEYDFIKPEISGKDIADPAKTRIVLREPDTGDPVIEATIWTGEETWKCEANRLGKYYAPSQLGYRQWATTQWKKYLRGERNSPPFRDIALTRVNIWATSPDIEYIDVSIPDGNRIILGRKDKNNYDKVERCALKIPGNSGRFLGMWVPGVNIEETPPLKVLTIIRNKVTKVPIPKKYNVIISATQPKTRGEETLYNPASGRAEQDEPGKGVLFFVKGPVVKIMERWKGRKLTKDEENFVEDYIVPPIEEGLMFLAAWVCGLNPVAYASIRVFFVFLHGYQHRKHPGIVAMHSLKALASSFPVYLALYCESSVFTGFALTITAGALYALNKGHRETQLPGQISAISIIPLALYSLVGINALSLLIIAYVGVLYFGTRAHIDSNRYVTLHPKSRLRKAVLGGEEKPLPERGLPENRKLPQDFLGPEDEENIVETLYRSGEVTITTADGGEKFVFEFSSKDPEIAGVEQDFVLDIFVVEKSGKMLIGYAHASVTEGRDWEKLMIMRGALYPNQIAKRQALPIAPAFHVLDEYQQRGIDRSAISMLLRIAQRRKVYRAIAEAVAEKRAKTYREWDFRNIGLMRGTAAEGGEYLEFLLNPREENILFPVIGIDERQIKGATRETPGAAREDEKGPQQSATTQLGTDRLAMFALNDEIPVMNLVNLVQASVESRPADRKAAIETVRDVLRRSTRKEDGEKLVRFEELLTQIENIVQVLPNVKGGPEVVIDYRLVEISDHMLIVKGEVGVKENGKTKVVGNFSFNIESKGKIDITFCYPIGDAGTKRWRDYRNKGISQTFLYWLSGFAMETGASEIVMSTPWLCNVYAHRKYYADSIEIDGHFYMTHETGDFGLFDKEIMGNFEVCHAEFGHIEGDIALEYLYGSRNKYRVVQSNTQGLLAGGLLVGRVVRIDKGYLYGERNELLGMLGQRGATPNIRYVRLYGAPKIPSDVAAEPLELIISPIARGFCKEWLPSSAVPVGTEKPLLPRSEPGVGEERELEEKAIGDEVALKEKKLDETLPPGRRRSRPRPGGGKPQLAPSVMQQDPLGKPEDWRIALGPRTAYVKDGPGPIVPVQWYTSDTSICQQWIPIKPVTPVSSKQEELYQNMCLIVGLLETLTTIEKNAIMVNIGSGPSPLPDIGNVTIVNTELEGRLAWAIEANKRGANYLEVNLARLPEHIGKIKLSKPGGVIQCVALCTDMRKWLNAYVDRTFTWLPKRFHNLDTKGKVNAMLQNAWGVLEGDDAFLIVTGPGCQEFTNRVHLFADRLHRIIVISDNVGDYKNAHAVIFWKKQGGELNPVDEIPGAARAVEGDDDDAKPVAQPPADTARENRLESAGEAYRKYGDKNVATVMGVTTATHAPVWELLKKTGGAVFKVGASENETCDNIKESLDKVFGKMEYTGVKKIVLYAPAEVAQRIEQMVREEERYRDNVIVIADTYEDLKKPDPYARHGLSLLVASCADAETSVGAVKRYLKQAFGVDVEAESGAVAIDTLDALLLYFFKSPLGVEPIWESIGDMRRAYKAVGKAI